MCQTCDLSGRDVSGFLSPYQYKDSDTDNLLEVPETIERCTVYKSCPKAHLHIQGQRVESRMVIQATSTSQTSNAIELSGVGRKHCFYDTETCYGVGYVIADSCSEAIRNREQRC